MNITEVSTNQIFIAAATSGNSAAANATTEVCNRIAAVLNDGSASILHERIFGSLSAEPEIMAARKRALGNYGIHSDGPVTYIEGNPPDGPGLAGVVIRAIVPQNAGDVWSIFDDDVPCGRGWRRNGVEYKAVEEAAARILDIHEEAGAAS